MPIVDSNFFSTLKSNNGSLYLDSKGDIAVGDYADIACYDLTPDPSVGEWHAGRVKSLLKVIVGVVVVLFLMVLILGVVIGLFAYGETKDGETTYDVFFGQGLRFGIGNAVAWEILMGLIAIMTISITLDKFDYYTLMSDDKFRSNKIAACAQQCKESVNSWRW